MKRQSSLEKHILEKHINDNIHDKNSDHPNKKQRFEEQEEQNDSISGLPYDIPSSQGLEEENKDIYLLYSQVKSQTISFSMFIKQIRLFEPHQYFERHVGKGHNKNLFHYLAYYKDDASLKENKFRQEFKIFFQYAVKCADDDALKLLLETTCKNSLEIKKTPISPLIKAIVEKNYAYVALIIDFAIEAISAVQNTEDRSLYWRRLDLNLSNLQEGDFKTIFTETRKIANCIILDRLFIKLNEKTSIEPLDPQLLINAKQILKNGHIPSNISQVDLQNLVSNQFAENLRKFQEKYPLKQTSSPQQTQKIIHRSFTLPDFQSSSSPTSTQEQPKTELSMEQELIEVIHKHQLTKKFEDKKIQLENERLKKQIEELNHQIEKQKNTELSFRLEIKDKETCINNLKEQNTQKTDEIARLNLELSQKKEEISKGKTEITHLKQTSQHKDKTIQKLNTDIENMTCKITVLKSENEKSISELQNLGEENKNLKTQNEKFNRWYNLFQETTEENPSQDNSQQPEVKKNSQNNEDEEKEESENTFNPSLEPADASIQLLHNYLLHKKINCTPSKNNSRLHQRKWSTTIGKNARDMMVGLWGEETFFLFLKEKYKFNYQANEIKTTSSLKGFKLEGTKKGKKTTISVEFPNAGKYDSYDGVTGPISEKSPYDIKVTKIMWGNTPPISNNNTVTDKELYTEKECSFEIKATTTSPEAKQQTICLTKNETERMFISRQHPSNKHHIIRIFSAGEQNVDYVKLTCKS